MYHWSQPIAVIQSSQHRQPSSIVSANWTSTIPVRDQWSCHHSAVRSDHPHGIQNRSRCFGMGCRISRIVAADAKPSSPFGLRNCTIYGRKSASVPKYWIESNAKIASNWPNSNGNRIASVFTQWMRFSSCCSATRFSFSSGEIQRSAAQTSTSNSLARNTDDFARPHQGRALACQTLTWRLHKAIRQATKDSLRTHRQSAIASRTLRTLGTDFVAAVCPLEDFRPLLLISSFGRCQQLLEQIVDRIFLLCTLLRQIPCGQPLVCWRAEP